MNKLLSAILTILLTLPISAATSLLSGSIDFNNHALWDKEIHFGLDDNGNESGATHWWTQNEEGTGATILKYSGRASGYLKTSQSSIIHRTISPLSPSEKTGPKAAGGVIIPNDGIYVDTRIAFSVGTKVCIDKTPAGTDKISAALVASDLGGSAKFVITAGSTMGAKDYATTAAVSPNAEIQLTFKAAVVEGEVLFEVFVNGEQVTSEDGVSEFPSKEERDSEYALKLYSMGISGAARVDRINFSKVDPRTNPDYDLDDVSMLRESAEIKVDKYPKNGNTLYDFPILVRVSEKNIEGFKYSRAASNGSDIRFTDENGKLLPHEIDVWDQGGESLIWVKVPVFRYGAKITMHWSARSGTAAPIVNSQDVWSDYVGVWHMGTQSLSVTDDSSGNGLRARAANSPSITDDSKIGQAAAMYWNLGVTNMYIDSSYKRYLGADGSFTFTGWHVAKANYPDNRFGNSSLWPFGTIDKLIQPASGWAGGNPYSKTRLTYRAGNGADSYIQIDGSDLTKNWYHSTFINEANTNYVVYLNGTARTGYVNGRNIIPNENPLRLMAEGFFADEIRLSAKIRSAEWVKAEYDQAQQKSYLAYGAGEAKDKDNYWVEEPYVKPNAVTLEDVETLEFFAGTPRYGTPYLQFYDSEGKQLPEQPKTPGVYKVAAVVSPGVKDGLRTEMTFAIFEKRAYSEITGYNRVMLFNSDKSAVSPVTLQGYYDVDSATNLVWEHTGTAWAGQGRFVKPGNMHTYFEPVTHKELWRFEHARIGNLFRDDTHLAAQMNFLPWGGTAMRFDDSEMEANTQRYAGTLILQNNSEAKAESPLYEEGVGTIYFDAVNAHCGYANALKVQIRGTEIGDEWEDVPVDVFAITNGVWCAEMSTNSADQVNLAMNKVEGSTDWFYRVRASVNTNEAVKVRIIRSDKNWNNEGDEDGDGLIEIDNIIISYPAMGIALSQYGASEDKDNPMLVGWRAPFDVAFPTEADLGKMHGQVKVRYITNNNEADPSFVGSLMMKYRWRYLDQAINDWKEIPLQVSAEDPTRFVTVDALQGEGIGDIEYSFSATVNAPFYEYYDYSGLATPWFWPDKYTERRGNVRISALEDGVYSPSNISPALGTDYFIRLREGKSDYESFRLHIRSKIGEEGAEVETIIPMRLADEHTWRGFMPSENDIITIDYKIEAVNQQLATGCDYQWTTNWYHGANKTALPVSDVIEEGNEWTTIPCDNVSGYLMFQVEDNTHSLSVIHADYQDFNLWTDANLADGNAHGHFIGTSSDLTKTSGVSRTARRYDDSFARLYSTPSENELLWTERFNVSSTNGEWEVEKPFNGNVNTPRAWTAGNGMWVCERFREFGGATNSIAFQMRGEGLGTLTFPQGCTPYPKGAENFVYSARIAQSYDINSFNYYIAPGAFQQENGTFAVPCSMTMTNRLENTEFTGVGTVSAVARYFPSRGCYEARVERIKENKVQLGIYKWDGYGRAKLLNRSAEFDYKATGFSGGYNGASQWAFGAIFISCTNTKSSVRITAGILRDAKYASNSKMFDGVNVYNKITYEDSASDKITTGTYGVGSKDCPAKFLRPIFSTATVNWDPSKDTTSEVLGAEEQTLISSTADYQNWAVYKERLDAHTFTLSARDYYGFEAQVPNQYLIVETSPHAGAQWVPVATNVVKSFGFETYVTPLYIADDIDIRLTTGRESKSCDVVIDNASLRQWRGEDFDDGENTSQFYDILDGAPTNFVYTTAWITSQHELLLSPMRTTVDTQNLHRPSSVRSPLMDGRSGRGTGLGHFSFAYRNADKNARLIVQVYTNSNLSVNNLRNLTKSFDGWTDVETIRFSDMTEDQRANGVISYFVGMHGISGVMRVIVDPELVKEAHDHSYNRNNDPKYGQISIIMASAKDNPDLDKGSWWGWNLRTTNEPMKWLLNDGTKNDTRKEGLAFALNNSISNDVRADDVYDLHKPFLQTPILATNCIGEVSFKARKYDANDPSPTIAIYGMKVYDPTAADGQFTLLTNMVVDCVRYKKFTYQMPISEEYTALRLAITGVDGIVGDGTGDIAGPVPQSGHVERVLIDEVAVYEAIRARLGFCNTGAFRFHLDDDKMVPDVPSRNEQPLCDEAWGIQTELYAAQLSEKIDLTNPEHAPRVFFHWFEGSYPWGYVNWESRADAHHAELARAEGTTNLVFRSSVITAPDAVVQPSQMPGTIMQYSLQVIYYMEGSDVPMTNMLSSADWQKPEWYEPIDLNAEYGGSGAFAAYNILDTVAPGWAWINEFNIFGKYTRDGYNSDLDCQYVEVAAPAEADLSAWQIRFLVPRTEENAVITNTIATFGMDDLAPKKEGLLNSASGMVFRVVASKRSSATLKKSDGTLDGYWNFPNPDGSALSDDGECTIYEAQPIGVQLIRPTGIVEHEIVLIGTNFWGDAGIMADLYNPSNVTDYLNKHMRHARFVYVGDDDAGERNSLSVWDSRGEISNVWDRTMIKTPGAINTYADLTPQHLEPTHPTPMGSSIIITAKLGGEGHIYQTCGEGIDTKLDQLLIIPKGSLYGTNIYYRTDKWYELKGVTTNGVEVIADEDGDHLWKVNVGRGMSNNFTVVASDMVEKRLQELGVDENNRYKEAIMDWLNKGTDIFGREWREDDGDIHLAQWTNPARKSFKDLTLTKMYWLDMCPTISNQYLVAGFVKPPVPIVRHPFGPEGIVLTNRTMSIYMAISNGLHGVEAPYVIRGMVPGTSSLDYDERSLGAWTNANFNIKGILSDKLTYSQDANNWVMMRGFAFKPNSFFPKGDEREFQTDIEIADPFVPYAGSYVPEWRDWVDKHGWTPNVYFRWDLDERMRGFSIEFLNPQNLYPD